MSALDSVKQPVTRSREFLQECWAELKRVHFPTRKDTRAATIAVIVGVIIVSLYLALVDYAWTRLIQALLPG